MDIYLLIVTLLAIAIVILGVSWWKWHAFISLTVASLFLAIMSGLNLTKIVTAYESGVGSVLGHLVGILALGTILGKMMSDSGAGMQVADFFIRFFGVKKLPWAMLFAGFVIGIPVFFEVGIVILLPLVISIRKTTKQNILLIALPVIAGLSIVHGLVPPHPGAMTAIGIYNANLGKVLLYSLLIALPTAIIAGPIFAKWVHKRVIPENEPELIRVTTVSTDLPSRKVSFCIILLPVVLMILSVVAPYISLPKKMTEFFVFIGSPVIALLISCFAAFYLLGIRQGINKKMIKKLTDESLLPVGSIILIIGAGGGFKQILIESGVGTAIAQMAEHISLSPIVLAFMVAGLIRIATGSATVALTTAAGIVSPVIQHMSGVNLELLVIATGAGSLMFSHVNDAGYWLVKEYLGLTVKETFKTWTVLETLLSFIAFGFALVLNMFL
ncbi:MULTISPECIES: gluconate permease GntP [Bacillus]|uniref:2-keto-3-deoxygluconate permease n=1 Tax=Bacillus thuringiensis serovar vazensis TaxID=180867 RepID=A0A243CMN2_BACTU|nr:MULTISPECIES: gluconate permease GntP [Bacillus]EEM87265.1 gluconate permease, GntP family permease [Bacillus thuringiensis serovar pulsiensis BGSC 4CC1]MEB9907997.1 gluconate permease GntP [Bacillus anthracis]MEC0902482.1 gluconate permease GntP [Bacillus anthracis]MEC1952956.1 gluconate permease GntP [Bacillus anthracis]OTY66939.1 2-keto-3-deoxygluconate permease [Bacillus thuringiensis serovar vazensis]